MGNAAHDSLRSQPVELGAVAVGEGDGVAVDGEHEAAERYVDAFRHQAGQHPRPLVSDPVAATGRDQASSPVAPRSRTAKSVGWSGEPEPGAGRAPAK